MLKINDFESQNMLQTKTKRKNWNSIRKNNGNFEAFNNKIKPHRNCHLLFALPLWYSFEVKLSTPSLFLSLSLWCIYNSSADISLASSHSALGSHGVHYAMYTACTHRISMAICMLVTSMIIQQKFVNPLICWKRSSTYT